jgi:hypothetical protein
MIVFSTILRAVAGFSSKKVPSLSLRIASTAVFASLETSLSFVCDENDGSCSFTLMTAVRPSRMSSPESPFLTSLKRFALVP